MREEGRGEESLVSKGTQSRKGVPSVAIFGETEVTKKAGKPSLAITVFVDEGSRLDSSGAVAFLHLLCSNSRESIPIAVQRHLHLLIHLAGPSRFPSSSPSPPLRPLQPILQLPSPTFLPIFLSLKQSLAHQRASNRSQVVWLMKEDSVQRE